jgi:hypothetical protein
LRRQLDRRDDLARLQVGVALRRFARQTMEVAERDGAFAAGSAHVDGRVERRERDAHVGRMRGDAVRTRAEDSVLPVHAMDRRTAAAGRAFVARRRGVVEIPAARPLQQVAAGRGHVAQLLRSARQDRARQQRVAALDHRVVRKIAVRHERADPQAAVRRFLDPLERQLRDVDQPRRPFDVLLHQVDQIGAAGDEFGVRIRAGAAHRIRDVGGARVFETDHARAPFITCRIAATMFG